MSSNTIDATELAQRTVYCILSFGSFGTSRKVPPECMQVKQDITAVSLNPNDAVSTDSKMLKTTKLLLDSAELKAITKLDGEARKFMNDRCAPFQPGIHLLPLGLVAEVDAFLLLTRANRKGLVKAFIDVYDSLIQSAKERLGYLFRAGDYPAAEEASKMFTMEWQYISFAVPDQLKMVSETVFKAEEEKQEVRLNRAIEEIRARGRAQAHTLIKKFNEKLVEIELGAKKVRISTIYDNIATFVIMFPMKDVTDDHELGKLVGRIREVTETWDIDQIKGVLEIREKVHEALAEVETALEALVEASVKETGVTISGGTEDEETDVDSDGDISDDGYGTSTPTNAVDGSGNSTSQVTAEEGADDVNEALPPWEG